MLFRSSGNLAFGQAISDVTLGSNLFQAGKRNEIKAWIVSVNNGSDLNNQNDSTIKNLYASFCGTYTVGGVSPDINNFTELSNALNIAGVLCPVVFKVRPGVYNEQVKFISIPGASEINSIKFQSDGGDSLNTRIEYSLFNPSNDFTLLLDGTNYMTFEKIGIKRIGGSKNIRLKGTAGNLSFNNCLLGKIRNENVYLQNLLFEKNNMLDSVVLFNSTQGQNLIFNSNKFSKLIYLKNWNNPKLLNNIAIFAGAKEIIRIENSFKSEINGNKITVQPTSEYNQDIYAMIIDQCDSAKIINNTMSAQGDCSFNIPAFLSVLRSNALYLANNTVTLTYNYNGCGTRPSAVSLYNVNNAFLENNNMIVM